MHISRAELALLSLEAMKHITEIQPPRRLKKDNLFINYLSFGFPQSNIGLEANFRAGIVREVSYITSEGGEIRYRAVRGGLRMQFGNRECKDVFDRLEFLEDAQQHIRGHDHYQHMNGTTKH